MPDLTVTELVGSGIHPAQWDSFARQCKASGRSAYRHTQAWAVKHRLRSRLRRFELHIEGDGVRRKVGQCAIGQAKHERIFLDRLQLLPDSSAMWKAAMAALLHAAGPGRYVYGWTQNLERSRDDDLRQIPGVTVGAVRPITVEAVDFSRWRSWEDYWHATSNNIRRNVRKAQTEIPDLALESHRGVRSLADVPTITRLRAATLGRKGLTMKPVNFAASTAGTILSCPEYTFTAVAFGRGQVLAAFSGLQFGSSTYYVDGGSASGNSGASWYLMMNMLREAYERDPDGKFVMGYVDYAIHQEAVGGGLIRSRRSCRVTDYGTSIVSFVWSTTHNRAFAWSG